MKPQPNILLALLLCLTTAASYSQTDNRPKIFQNLPETIALTEASLQYAFTASEGQDINLPLSSIFSFPGKVLSNLVKYHNLQSITIRSAVYDNAILHLSKIINDDNTISYVGRIMNERAYDGYEIKRKADGSYNLVKFETGLVMQDCSF